MAEHGLAPDDLVITTGRFRRGEGARRTRESLERLRDCDALVCASDLLALGAMFALREAGIGTPDDIAVVGFDGTDDGAYAAPPLTSARQPVAAMAEAALDALRQPNDVLTIVVPHFIARHRWHNLLHAQTARTLRRALLGRKDIVVTDVPYHLTD